MPLYEYQCDACERRFEVIQKFSDPPVEVCKVCGKGPVQRLPSSPAIQFKGSGWYITDYAKKPGSDKGGSAGEKGGEAKTGGDAKAGGDTKSEGGPKTESGAKTEAPAKSAPSTSTTTSKE